MRRRTFLTGLPASLLAVPALARPRKVRSPALVFKGKARIAALTAWTDGRVARPSIVARTGRNGSHVISLKSLTPALLSATAAFGLRIGPVPGFKQGVAFWRYAPWKSWTKPMAMTRSDDLQSDDVQCAYWQYGDGTYAVALPLGGGGFRSTLGAANSAMITVCKALGPAPTSREMPQVAIGFGTDLYATMAAVFEDAMMALGTPENLRKHKALPEALTYLGWNTWNASDLGHELSADWVIDQVTKIRATGAPIRTVVLDDGHFQARDSALQSQKPNAGKFPDGFKPVVDKLLNEHGLKHVGLWHAFNAYWNGIDPESELGHQLAGKLFTWTQKPSPVDTSGKTVTYSFLKPEYLDGYFDAYHADLKTAGFSLLKVDNQLVTERMARDNYPIWDLATALHGAINKGAAKYFDNALINCMDMTNDAFLNFGATAVARSVEDYFPYKPTETYDLQEGNAAAHVVQAMYNALYFGEMVFPDFDMFESTNPNAALHASVRAANCAPIYITDKAGQHDVTLLESLVDADGVTLRADTPLRPCADCLFQIQQPVLFKASSRVGDGALLLLANLADTASVIGPWHLADVTGLPQGDYVVYSSSRQKAERRPWPRISTELFESRFGHDLLWVAPVHNRVAVLGLKEKRNGPASVRDIVRGADGITMTARDEGTLLIWCEIAPKVIAVDGAPASFTFANNLLSVSLAAGSRAYRVFVG